MALLGSPVRWADIAALGGEHPGLKMFMFITEGPLHTILSESSDASSPGRITMTPLIVLQITEFRQGPQLMFNSKVRICLESRHEEVPRSNDVHASV